MQRARADASAQTRARILGAVHEHAQATLDLDPTLAAIADRAGVSVQTVLRHFGSRDALLDAAIDAVGREVADERAAPPGDLDVAVRTLVEHYELRGDFVLRMLAREPDDARLARVVALGRAQHRAWVEAVFAPWLDAAGEGRETLIDLLVVATDLYSWKLLRRDRGLSASTVEARLRRLVDGVLRTERALVP
ncbi:MAG: TetR/AcrR family transcriptional regulator [Solirubrobacteraceae bacterium]|nr:TetR/AcrR family transcriptional regulator [Solirubrobacteraceae bacterium]